MCSRFACGLNTRLARCLILLLENLLPRDLFLFTLVGVSG
jgi:hypothetical protein